MLAMLAVLALLVSHFVFVGDFLLSFHEFLSFCYPFSVYCSFLELDKLLEWAAFARFRPEVSSLFIRVISPLCLSRFWPPQAVCIRSVLSLIACLSTSLSLSLSHSRSPLDLLPLTLSLLFVISLWPLPSPSLRR